MNLKLYKIAANAVKSVYDGKCFNIGSTEYYISETTYNNKPLQVLAIGGTNEPIDWFHNFNPMFWDGVKLGSYISARRILKRFKKTIPLLIVTHSKSAPTGFYLNQILKADYCISFCPTPGLRKALIMPNTVMFIDPDDIVPKIGKLMFKHPLCVRHMLPDEVGLFSIRDHYIEHVIEYLNTLKELEKYETKNNI